MYGALVAASVVLILLITYKTTAQLQDGVPMRFTLAYMVAVAIAQTTMRLCILGITLRVLIAAMGFWQAISAHLLACVILMRVQMR